MDVKQLVDGAVSAGQTTLSEYDSKQVLAAYGVPVVEEILATTEEEAVAAGERLGYPVALKACGASLSHKSDRGWVRLHLNHAAEVQAAASALLASGAPTLLVQRMARGRREIIVGALRDAVFGPCVMLGLGGTAVEALEDVSFRLAPLDARDAAEMVAGLRGKRLLDAFRGDPPVDRSVLTQILQSAGQILLDHPRISHVDINPLVIEAGRPVAVDALISLGGAPEAAVAECAAPSTRFKVLFEPASIVIVGASEAPVKWGFRILFNTLEGGYQGKLYGVNPKHGELLGVPCFPNIEALPETPDLAMIVIPPQGVCPALRACVAKGIPAVVVITAGFDELEDSEAKAMQEEMREIAAREGLLLIGPNCAGVASPAPYSMYAGMIARYPGPGGLSVVSQSGNVGSTVLTWAQLHQVGVARFMSSGNEAVTRTEDCLSFFADDDRTASVLTYVEGTRNGRRFFDVLRKVTAKKPLVLIKGGRSQAGMKAAQSHTGSMASETRVFKAACRQAGVTVVDDVYEAMEIGAAFLRQPLPKGRRVGIVSQGGGWGVITADACMEAGLEVPPLDAETMHELDGFMPAWWNRNNPVDLVAANDLFLLSKAVESVMKSPGIDAVILLGVGYIASSLTRFGQSDRAKAIGLDKLAQMGSHYEIEDARRMASFVEQYQKPLLVASDTALLAYVGTPNGVIQELEQAGICVLPSPAHVARALAHLVERYEFLQGIPRK